MIRYRNYSKEELLDKLDGCRPEDIGEWYKNLREDPKASEDLLIKVAQAYLSLNSLKCEDCGWWTPSFKNLRSAERALRDHLQEAKHPHGRVDLSFPAKHTDKQ